MPLIPDLPDFKWPAPIQTDPSQRHSSVQCDYHRDHGHETNRCQSLKFIVGRLIKVGHIRRYVREVDRGAESEPPVDRITTGAATPSKSKTTINYIPGGSFDDQYQSKRQQKKLMRAATVKARVNDIHTRGSREETKSIDDPISFPPGAGRSRQHCILVTTTCLQPDEAFLMNAELSRANPLWFQQHNNHDTERHHAPCTSRTSHPAGFVLSLRRLGALQCHSRSDLTAHDEGHAPCTSRTSHPAGFVLSLRRLGALQCHSRSDLTAHDEGRPLNISLDSQLFNQCRVG